MPGVSILWIHALAALLLFGAAVLAARARLSPWQPAALAVAFGLSALWALAVAGLGERDLVTRVMAGVRGIAWLAVIAMAAADGHGATVRRTRQGACLVTALCMALALVLTVGQAMAGAGEVALSLRAGSGALGMLSTCAALVLAYRTRIATDVRMRLCAAALTLMWAMDLTLLVAGQFLAAETMWPLLLLRGTGVAIGALAAAAILSRRDDGRLSVSRTMALRSVQATVLVAFVILTIVATLLLGDLAGRYARMVQTAFIIGCAAAALTVASTPWPRAWLKVIVAKHLFDHRYDYRTEWLRFTETLGAPGEDAPALSSRVVKAMADLTDSPSGRLLLVDHGALVAAGAWGRTQGSGEAGDAALVHHLEATRRIVEIDAARAGTAPAEERAVLPHWLTTGDEAWALVPLIHLDRLIGAIVLDRPPVDRRLDWEDFDLLGVAGRQAASYLAEESAHAGLAEARRFEEFNRRFAFIMHDLKNLVSQMALVARNAERHADNPAFRADMIATLQDSSQRMTTLLARLSLQPAARGEVPRRVVVRALLERLAVARRAQHPVRVEGDGDAAVFVDPTAVETLIGHLVQNAIDASPAGSPVLLTVTADAGRVTIAVTDRGTGMSAAFVRDGLFRPFVSSKPTGFGLGAYEARELAAAMGGELMVESDEGRGSCFRLCLPAAASADDRITEQAA